VVMEVVEDALRTNALAGAKEGGAWGGNAASAASAEGCAR
jgi:hypothetical protein